MLYFFTFFTLKGWGGGRGGGWINFGTQCGDLPLRDSTPLNSILNSYSFFVRVRACFFFTFDFSVCLFVFVWEGMGSVLRGMGMGCGEQGNEAT